MIDPDQPYSGYPRPMPVIPRPWWVKVTMIGVRSRKTLLVCAWLSIATAFVCLLIGISVRSIVLIGVLMAVAAVPYFATIQWIDDYEGWSAAGRTKPFS